MFLRLAKLGFSVYSSKPKVSYSISQSHVVALQVVLLLADKQILSNTGKLLYSYII